MKKEMLIFLGVAALFAYLIMTFTKSTKVRDDSIGTGTQYEEGMDPEKLKDRYTVKDALGEPTLDFSNASMKEAKVVWETSNIRQNMLNYFPKFDLMKEYINNRLLPSKFRKALLNKIDQVQTDYLSGAINSAEALSQLKSF